MENDYAHVRMVFLIFV